MKIVKDGIVLSPKETHTDDVQASDALVKQKSEEIEKKYAEAFRLLAKGEEKMIKGSVTVAIGIALRYLIMYLKSRK